MISFYFEKSTEMTIYPIGIKVRHEIKTHGILNKSITNFVAVKQVIIRIINKFFDLALNDGSQMREFMMNLRAMELVALFFCRGTTGAPFCRQIEKSLS
jgi:hypothetical protein